MITLVMWIIKRAFNLVFLYVVLAMVSSYAGIDYTGCVEKSGSNWLNACYKTRIAEHDSGIKYMQFINKSDFVDERGGYYDAPKVVK